MNMLLHGIRDADIRNGDTLAEPQHVEGGELMRFDRVITNPPFSQNYDRATACRYPERFRYGWAPEGGKKADLMFVQHMVAVLEAGRASAATVMPHGVLFRGGDERDIRTRHARGRPARGGHRPARRTSSTAPASRPASWCCAAPAPGQPSGAGKVLFINADREFTAGRAQNYLLPEHVEKIVTAYQAVRATSPATPRVVARRRSWRPTTSTSTSAATPTTRRRPSRTTCAPTCTAASPGPR